MIGLEGLAAAVFTGSAQFVGTVIVIAVPLLLLYWRKSIQKAIQKKLDVHVVRLHKGLIQAVHSGPLAPYMDVDETYTAAEFPDMKMISIVDYMGSLQPKGTFSLQSALISVLDKSGIRVALPLALFAPESWQQQQNPVALFQNTHFAGLLLGNMISTLGIATISLTSHRQYLAAKRDKGKKAKEAASNSKTAAEKQPPSFTALEVMVRGSNPKTDGGLSSHIGNLTTITIPDDVPAAAGIEASDMTNKHLPLQPGPEPKLAHPLVFPDLYVGNGGLPCICSAPQAKVNEVFAAMLNKLAANMLVGLDLSPAVTATEPYTVRLKNSPQATIDSVEDLIDALEATGHTISMKMYSALTSFGVGFSVKETNDDGKEEWIHIPLCFPMSTGLLARNENNEPVDAVTLMQHAGITLSVSGPLLTADVEWCLNIAGMTGFIPRTWVHLPWAEIDGAKKYHAEDVLATAQGRRAALRHMAVSATVNNLAADRGRLMFGGYGALGVCIDSVAGVQQALTGECSLYPLMLAAEAKMALLGCYKAVKERGLQKGGGSYEYTKEIDALFEATEVLKCDAVVEPKDAAAVAKRILACMPKRTVFSGLERCRESIQYALKTAEAIVE